MDKTGLANMALGRLGNGKAIAALTENSVEAKACNRFFDQCRQEVLRAHPWGFANRAEALAIVAGETYPGWGYVYQYPNDCLRVRNVGDESGMQWLGGYRASGGIGGLRSYDVDTSYQVRIPWQLGLKADGVSQVILSSVQSAWAFFTADVENTGAWPADFSSVFADRLAMEIGGPLLASRPMIAAAEQRFAIGLSRASATNMNEQKDTSRPESPSISCRY